MQLKKTPIDGAWIIETSSFEDDRGSFLRTYCEKSFSAYGLHSNFLQCNLSKNNLKATLRGLHMQTGDHSEVKLVRAVTGKIFDVAVDLRINSPSYLKWYGIELCSSKNDAFYIPQGCAHGFITLEDNSSVIYQVSNEYSPAHEQGYRWDDPAFDIKWPLHPVVLSVKDSHHKNYEIGNF